MPAHVRKLVDELRSSLNRSFSRRRQEVVPKELWHYTTAAGFEAIVRTRRLRATNFSFLNDPSEVAYGLNLIQRLLQEEIGPDYRDEVGAWFLRRVLANLNNQMLSETHVCCFTGLRDDLSQWRAYGGGSVERYALSFYSAGIRAAVDVHDDARFRRVIYNFKEQKRRVRFVIARALASVRSKALTPLDVEPFTEVVAEQLAPLLPTFKSPAYEGEDEWRIVISRSLEDPHDVEIDTSRGVLRPYVAFDFPAGEPLPLAAVVVLAPTRSEAALKAANIVLRRAEIFHVRPLHSEVPFAD